MCQNTFSKMNELVYDHILLISCSGSKICPQVLWHPCPGRWYLCPLSLTRGQPYSFLTNRTLWEWCVVTSEAMQICPDLFLPPALWRPLSGNTLSEPSLLALEESTSHAEVMHRCFSQQTQPRHQNVNAEAILKITFPAPDVQGHSLP